MGFLEEVKSTPAAVACCLEGTMQFSLEAVCYLRAFQSLVLQMFIRQ